MSAEESKKKQKAEMVSVNAAPLPKGVTQEQVDAWIAKYGVDALGEMNVKTITLRSKTDPKKTWSCVVRNPDAKILGMAIPFMDKNMFKLCQTLITNCFLGGDEEIRTYPPFIFAAGGKISEWLDQVEADVINF